MRRFLDKVFKDSTIEAPLSAPSLPSDLTYTEMTYMTKRGYLARKLSQYLSSNHEEGDSAFYLSLAKRVFLRKKTENLNEQLLYLSEKMLAWNEQNQNIPELIEKLGVRNDIQNAMLKAYDMHQQDLFASPNIVMKESTVREVKQEEITTWTVYRDVIFAATQGHFLLITEEDVEQYKAGTVLCEGEIMERSDIPVRRNQAKEALEKKISNPAKIMSWLLVLSEAITNTIKHAEEGTMTVIEDEEASETRFIIEDRGPGFPLKDLPKTTLLAGYSTKRSMGQGFTLMMKMTKQVVLYTSPLGSTIILIFDSSEGIE
ncbi:ATP-binding protein [Halalkalibacter alkaliphilus]|uniref:ATP-binding protein n=1 Tax=Halalkalibacter alkaliphilus TaxID=2917993 RepID=A0A9X2A6V3_9BACI|nr:ATP-binding protein [Halalkalibacter alkaliphilus]MCL7746716.1 ATP-binding protein [Halalkalibacter alkaliphilus]